MPQSPPVTTVAFALEHATLWKRIGGESAHPVYGAYLHVDKELAWFSPYTASDIAGYNDQLQRLFDVLMPRVGTLQSGANVRETLKTWATPPARLSSQFFKGTSSREIGIKAFKEVESMPGQMPYVSVSVDVYIEDMTPDGLTYITDVYPTSAMIPHHYLDAQFPNWQARWKVAEGLELNKTELATFVFDTAAPQATALLAGSGVDLCG